MFRIGEFSKLCGLSADTLYHYEKQKILIPFSVDAFTGYRYYDASQMITVNKILALKDAGFSLNEISEILKSETSVELLLKMLQDKAQLLENTLEEEIHRLDRLHTNIFLIKNGGIPQMNEIIVKTVEPILVASTRKKFSKTAFDENLEEMWSTVNDYINEKGIKRTVPCLMLYHSGWWDIKECNLNYDELILDTEVVEPVTKNFESCDKVQVYELPKVEKMACIVHHGSFQTIGQTFDSLFEWMRCNHYVADGPIREIYHKGEWVTDDPNEYITELQIPIQ